MYRWKHQGSGFKIRCCNYVHDGYKAQSKEGCMVGTFQVPQFWRSGTEGKFMDL